MHNSAIRWKNNGLFLLQQAHFCLHVWHHSSDQHSATAGGAFNYRHVPERSGGRKGANANANAGARVWLKEAVKNGDFTRGRNIPLTPLATKVSGRIRENRAVHKHFPSMYNIFAKSSGAVAGRRLRVFLSRREIVVGLRAAGADRRGNRR